MIETYIHRLAAWAPGIETPGEWDEWALGKREILSETKTPELTYTDSTFRRRLSQISKMSIQVIHDLLPIKENTKILFFSFRGELVREYQLYRMLMEEGALRPAAFSLSGFNTPVALATIAFGLKGGYSALYPANNSFLSCIKAAQAALFSGTSEELVLLYADELVPEDCRYFFSEVPVPLAFGFILSQKNQPSSIPLSSLKNLEKDTPPGFLRQILLSGSCSS